MQLSIFYNNAYLLSSVTLQNLMYDIHDNIVFLSFYSNGKAVHYNGASLLQWRSVRLDVTLNAGDVAGIGWERTGESPVQGQTPRGRVYFTYNGRRLNAYMDDVSGCMFPVVHIQKKVCATKQNLHILMFHI